MIRIAVSIYAAMLHDHMHFAQASYRDGEWRAILGYDGRNVNGEEYVPELGDALTRTLKQPVGQWCAFWIPGQGGERTREVRERAARWIAEHEPNVRWIADRMDGEANAAGHMAPFFAAARTRRAVLVGPRHLTKLPASVLTPAAHVVVRDSDAWKHEEETSATIRRVLESGDIVLFAAGMASNLMIHRLWPEYRGEVTLYDIGAALDPYCGVQSRAIYRRPEWPATMKRNLAA